MKFRFALLCFAACAVSGLSQQPAPDAPAAPKQPAISDPASDPAEGGKPGALEKDAAPKPVGTEKLPPAPAGLNPDTYVIGPEDVLYVRVWKDGDLSGLVDVRPDGMISMQLIGEIKASGLTPEQLSKVVAEKLLTTHRHPEVNVQVVKVLSKKYFILGEVRKPGPYTFVVPTKVLDALANAGGFNDFAKTKKIYVLRGTQRFPFNYNEVSRGKRAEQNILVQSGDQIFVP